MTSWTDTKARGAYLDSGSGALATFKVGRDLENNDTVINEKLIANNISGSDPNHLAIDTFNINTEYEFMTNTFYEVSLDVIASTRLRADTLLSQFPVQNDLTSFASIDPAFQIDPAYKDYSIAFSRGISTGSVSPVPLPASAPMFGAALLGLGVVGYGMKRKGSTLA